MKALLSLSKHLKNKASTIPTLTVILRRKGSSKLISKQIRMDDKKAECLCGDFWQWRLRESPELGSFSGFHQFDDSWDDVSSEAYQRRDTEIAEFLKRARSLKASDCSKEVGLSLSMLTKLLELYSAGAGFPSEYFPINNIEGIHSESNMSISYMKFNSEKDLEKYICRLKRLPKRINQAREMLEKGVGEGITMHKCSIEKVPNQIKTILDTDTDKLDLLEPLLKDEMKNLTLAKPLNDYISEAKNLITSQVFPALEHLSAFITTTYLPASRPDIAISSLPNGPSWYQQCLDYHLTCHMTPQEVHDVGLKEVKRIRENILKVAAEEGLGDTLPTIMENLVKTQKNKFKSKEEILAYVNDLCSNRIRPKLAKLFKGIPDLPMTVKPFPEYMQDGPAGYYLNGTTDGTREGAYYVNTNCQDSFAFNLPALSLHEGEPGHHLQAVYMLSATSLPDFRRYVEDAKYYLPPHNFPFYTAYVEGWGLYSEALGEELGVYQSNLEMLGRYSFEIFRACRLVVDTGMHAFGWSRERALQYMAANSLEPQAELAREVDRYVTWPGQACAYKIGELKIWELRRKAEAALGAGFDVQEFHSRLLQCGSVPLDVLSDIVEGYIAEAKA